MAARHVDVCRDHQSGSALPRGPCDQIGRRLIRADIAAVVGPTASGKSAIAEAAADRFGAAIISVDSVQVYRGLDIGTAKPAQASRDRFDYRMIDVCEPEDDLSVQAYQSMARLHLDSLGEAGKRVVAVGGSGLHFRSLVDPLTFAPTDEGLRVILDEMDPDDVRAELLAADPTAGNSVDLLNSRRLVRALEIYRLTGDTPTARAIRPERRAIRDYEPLYAFQAVGLDAMDASRERVQRRLTAMLDAGLLDEVALLRPRMGNAAAQALGYKEFFEVVDGTKSLDSARAEVEKATFAFVKRQRTYFRRDPRIMWLTWEDDASKRIDGAVDRIGEMMQWTS